MGTTSEGIPKIIHFVWIGDDPMPDWARANVNEWRHLNPTYSCMVHGEAVLVDELRPAYEQLTDLCARADLLRYSALMRFGGWYFDCDFWPFRPLDDVARAHALDGTRALVAQQNHQKNHALTVANGVLGIPEDWPGWTAVLEYVRKQKPPFERVLFGPRMFGDLTDRQPALFEISDWPWWFPAGPGVAGALYDWCREGRTSQARHYAPTGGQLPFAMHLWAGGKKRLNRVSHGVVQRADSADTVGLPLHGKRVCVGVVLPQWRDTTPPTRAVADGLSRLGAEVDICMLPEHPDIALYDLFVTWNGRRGWYKRAVDKARGHGVPCLVLEHGFFDRDNFFQLDSRDILHWASWADGIRGVPAPPQGADRLEAVWQEPVQPIGHRDGYVLALGQVAHDAQLQDSPISSGTELDKAVARCLRGGAEARFRRHPKTRPVREAAQYLPRCTAPTLREAVEGARCAVTINSNATVECLAWGCPVMTVGPSLAGTAGVALETDMDGFKVGLRQMLDGWRPEPDAVRNYLEWLACRQWSREELATGEPLYDALQGVLL